MYLKNHLSGGKGCIRFWTRQDWNSGFDGKDGSHRVIMKKKLVATLAPPFLIGSSFFQVTRITIKSGQSLNLGQMQS